VSAFPWVPDDERDAAFDRMWAEFAAECPEEAAILRETIEQGHMALALSPPIVAPGPDAVDYFPDAANELRRRRGDKRRMRRR
jgi:hypothetical protein